jgi:RHS repeat-associated protein
VVVFKKEATGAVDVDHVDTSRRIYPDHLNTPRLIADAQQRTVWRWDQQEPFGVNVPDENPSGLGAFDLPLRLPGQYFDKETNTNYNYSRDYDPAIGRYVESDPIGLVGGLNTYAYANGSPLVQIDPLGLAGGTTLLQKILEGLRREQVPSQAGVEASVLPHVKHAQDTGQKIGNQLCRGTRNYINDCLEQCVKTFNPNGVPSEGGGDEISACTKSCREAYVKCKYPPSSSCPAPTTL